MINKIFSSVSFTSACSRVRPYFTAKTSVISLLACGTLLTLGYFFFSRRKPGTTPQLPVTKPSPPSETNSPVSIDALPTPSLTLPLVNPVDSSSSLSYVDVQVSKSENEPLPPSPTPPVSLADSSSSLSHVDTQGSKSAIVAPLVTHAPVQNQCVLQDDPNFKHNALAIIDFPKEPNAQIKSFKGKLDRGDGLLRAYNSQMGTQLHETLPVIQNTFAMADAQYEGSIRAISDRASPDEKITMVRALCDAFAQEMNLLRGLENITKVYNVRYQSDPGHAGLKELNAFCEYKRGHFNAHAEQYKALIQSLQGPAASGPTLTASILCPQPKNDISIELAAESLSAYCDKYCPGISSVDARGRILNGQQLMRSILRDPSFRPSPDPKEFQNHLANITWFLMYAWGLQKKRGATEAAFVIENGSKLYEFVKASRSSYPRASSHFIGRSPANDGYSSYLVKSSMHHGIDIEEGLLPAVKRTILFEMVDSPSFNHNPKIPGQVLFFKPENWGTQGTLFQHSLEYVESVQKKRRGEGEDDALGVQKERVPDNAKKAFTALLSHIQAQIAIYAPSLKSLNPEIFDLKTAFDKAKLWGIAYMHAFISGLESHAQCPADFNAATESLKAIMAPLAHPDRQTGRELYITAKELEELVFADLKIV